MTDEELGEIERRASEALPGPWPYRSTERGLENSAGFVFPNDAIAREENVGASMEFICEARADVPALVAEVRRLLAEMKRLRAEAFEEAANVAEAAHCEPWDSAGIHCRCAYEAAAALRARAALEAK